MKKRLHRFWREWLFPAALFLAIMSPLRSAILDWNWVPTGSMKPTILEGDLVLVNKLAYDLKVPFTTHHLAQWGDPVRGDIAVFYSPKDGTRLVKRVVGLPGDTVELRDEILFINGVAQHYTPTDSSPFLREVSEDKSPVVAVEHLGECDHYVMALPHRVALRSFGPRVMPDHGYFMMGDSRDNSADSRFFGPVSRDQIVGRAGGVIASFDTSRYLLPRVSRFVHSLKLDKS
ncbi:MAG: signal peptidase [Verrucomicrobia bacterium]|nr:signal peptidase [Verrucomicrobiota bacterium]